MKTLLSLLSRMIRGCCVLVFALCGNAFATGTFQSRDAFAGNATFDGHLLTKRTLGVMPGASDFRIPIELVYSSGETGSGFFGKAWRSPQLESRAVISANKTLRWRALDGENRVLEKKGAAFESADGRFSARRSTGETITITEKNGLAYTYVKGQLASIESAGGRKIVIERKQAGDLTYLLWNQISSNLDHRTSSAPGATAFELCALEINALGQVQNLRLGGPKGQQHHFDYLGGADIHLARWQLLVSSGSPRRSPDASLQRVSNTSAFSVPRSALTESFLYDDRGFLRTAYDRDQNRFSYACDSKGLLLADYRYTYQVYPKGGGLKMCDRLGGETKWQMDREKKLLRITDADGGIQRIYFTPDPKSAGMKVAKILDRGGVKLQENRYDRQGNLTETRDKLGNRIQFQYDPEGRVVQVSRVNASQSSVIPSAARNPSAQILARYQYDPQGRVIQSEDQNGTLMKIAYTPQGEPSEIVKTGKQGTQLRFQLNYNDRGWVDSVGRQINPVNPVSKPAVKTARYQYSDDGRVQNYLDFDGNQVAFTYDPNGQVASISRSGSTRGPRLSRPGGDVPFGAPPNGSSANDVISSGARNLSASDSQPSTLRLFRDNYGRVIAKVDPLGRRWDYQLDKFGRVLAERDPRGAVTGYEYDKAGRLTAMTNPRGNQHVFIHTAAGQMASMADPLGNVTRWEYNEAGQLVHKNNGVQDIAYQHDDLGRLTSIDYGHGQVVNYTFDEAGNIARMNNPQASMEFSHDAKGRITRVAVTQQTGGLPSSYSLDYDYTAEEQVSKLTWKDEAGRKVYERAYAHDALNRLSGIAVNGQLLVSYDYAGDTQRIVAKHLKGGYEVQYRHDSEGRVTAMNWLRNDKPLLNVGYRWDSAGQLLSRSINGKTVAYQYDPAGQLLAVAAGNAALERYEYDLAGNMIARAENGRTTRMTYDQGNRLVSARVGAAASGDSLENKTWSYDAAGRLLASVVERGTSVEKRSFSYGYLDKVLSLSKTDAQGTRTDVAYQYLPNGMMAGKVRKVTVPAQFAANLSTDAVSDAGSPPPSHGSPLTEAQRFVWDGIALLGRETLTDGALDRQAFSMEPHVSGGSPLAVHSSNGDTLMASDHLSSTLAEIEAAEGALRLASMSSFGARGVRSGEHYSMLPASHESSLGSRTNPGSVSFFTGKPWDTDMEAYVFPYRNYSPDVSRWLSADPLGFPDGANQWAYCQCR